MTRMIFCASFTCWRLKPAAIQLQAIDHGGRFPEPERPSRRRSSIASIRINPDLFAAKYRYPPFFGGRHRDYIPSREPTNSTARSSSRTATASSMPPTRFQLPPHPAGRRRYGLELSGPIPLEEERLRAGTRKARHRRIQRGERSRARRRWRPGAEWKRRSVPADGFGASSGSGLPRRVETGR
jgi:hypothetical protein